MILAKEFSRHPNARNSDFTSNARDRPLVVQFAANDPVILGNACEMILPYTDAIGINCGCPQSWACQEGIGASLMQNPQLVSEMVKSAKNRCGRDLVIETKMRTHRDLKESVSWAQQMEKAGIDFLVIHGRTKKTRSSEPVDLAAIKLIKENVQVPVVANGDAFNMTEVNKIYETTGVDGVMSARGLLSNPALFAGYKTCPWSAIERFMVYAQTYELHQALIQHHVVEMMNSGGYWKKKDRIEFVTRRGIDDILGFLKERYVFREQGDRGYGMVDECISREQNNGNSGEMSAAL
ncbi:tRNA-dihydrouridine synthase [Taphrina deformans PYCC 5710]|uniref:tRNA-dihydrouridine synthase n=1 Tax=Taphrina deformans (strain PYCC 5710 / ATCC 11124 / CBS 356.35 / IMI 108563 / JCM 9778 / NBRC 8474) TaxID=1097556 RepID=R4X7L8_TAPDE|nr:tRNA-dihydrouridine synthase [Taphrina deformans PYCC 5710]|eukprot:CCG81400.1 tRNA-dihydrouridine synthase [Taphrina deformans PYCC 5710]